MHLKDDILRAYLDGELDSSAHLTVGAHLESCSTCQQQLALLANLAERVAAHLAVLDSNQPSSTRRAAAAWHRFQKKERQPMWKQYLRSPAWIALSIVLFLTISLAFQPVRALAANFLNLFRVQQITMLPMDMSSLRGSMGEPTIAEAMSRLFSDSMVMTREGSRLIGVSEALSASEEAGFTMRVSRDSETRDIIVRQGPAFEFTFDRQRAQAVLDQFGGGDLALPPNIDQVLVTVDIPHSIQSTYGDCFVHFDPTLTDPDQAQPLQLEYCLTLMQMPSPTVTFTPEVDPAPLAEVGLRFLGMDEAAARQFSRSVDWATTLVIPFPRNEVEVTPITIDGVDGNLLVEKAAEPGFITQYYLLWVKDGIIYALTGSGDPQNGIELANQLVDATVSE
jgi:hypothetical protein